MRTLIWLPLLSLISRTDAQVHVILGTNKDNTLYESSAGLLSNGAGQHFFAGRTIQATGSLRRGLIAFNIADSIPPNATIQEVTLVLNMSDTTTGGQTISLHKVLANWGEGTSVASGNEENGGFAALGDATWTQRYYLISLWTNPGGDFIASPTASHTVAGPGSYTWGSTPEMVSDVQQWLNNPSGNSGWLLLGNESTPGTRKRFDTKENTNANSRPRLQITYQPSVGVEEERPSPNELILLQNYPNPFNPRTVIAFYVPQSSRIVLSVRDILGREVATLVDEQKARGYYTVPWDASGSASGIYFYHLKASSFSQQRKMVLIR